MIMTNELIQQLNTELAEGTTLLATAEVLTIALVINDFAPTKDIVLVDLTLATFTGSTPKVVTTGNQTVLYDSETARRGVLLKEPVGGFNFVCTSAPGAPETVFGWALLFDAGSSVWAVNKLETPVVITSAGDFVGIPALFGYLQQNPVDDIVAPLA